MVPGRAGDAVILAEVTSRTPDAVSEALGLVDGLDDVLVHGLGRPGSTSRQALARLAGALESSPLGEAVAGAVRGVETGSVTDQYLRALAAARTALLGAAHDALLDELDQALGRSRNELPAAAVAELSVPADIGSWLRELAIAGWEGVDHALAASGSRAVPALLAEPRNRGLAVLIDGLSAELRAAAPVGSAGLGIPARRWADLWSHAILNARVTRSVETVSGRFLLLGTDLHEHPTAFRVLVLGLLEQGEEVRLARISLTTAKVDTITGPSAWRLLGGVPVLRGALAGHRALELTDMPLTDDGYLLWDESRAAVAEEVDPFVTARVRLSSAVVAPVPALERHPAALAEPVLLEAYTARDSSLDLRGSVLAVDPLPAGGPLTPELVAASSACIGLLRHDAGRWAIRVLAVQATVRKKPVVVHTGDWALGPTDARAAKAEALSGAAVDVLTERAGRLLRK